VDFTEPRTIPTRPSNVLASLALMVTAAVPSPAGTAISVPATCLPESSSS
jgi:hypothetical protein